MEEWYQKGFIYAFIIVVGSLLTVATFDTWQTVLLICLLLISMSYVFVLGIDKLSVQSVGNIEEGFTSNKESEAAKSKYEWLTNDDLFDDFYASVFTKLSMNEKLVQAESAICMEEFTKHRPKEQLVILDAGCGIGVGTATFKKLGAGSVVGIDKSPAMIRYAKGTTLPNTTLTDIQKQDIEFRQFDLIKKENL
jgi:hypothetical protein